MSEPLFRIVYCSRNAACGDLNQAELEQILAASRRNNARDGVSGALLHSSGIFAQVLEGPFDSVQEAFERIQVDQRHNDIIVLQADQVDSRSFGDWAMASAEPDNLSGTKAILAAALIHPETEGPQGILRLLEQLVRREPEWLVAQA